MNQTFLCISEGDLGESLNITFQQEQKCERGTNRNSTPRPWDMTLIISLPISYFFDVMSNDVMKSSLRQFSCVLEHAVEDKASRDSGALQETFGLART